MLAAKLGNPGQGIVVLMGLHPEPGKAGRNVLGQLLDKGHRRYPYGKKVRI
jgi:hypothetical protein